MKRHQQTRGALAGIPATVLTAILTLCIGSTATASPLDDCSTCIGTLTSPPGTVTDPLSGSTIDLTITHLSNGECSNTCVQEVACTFNFTQVIYIGGVGGWVSATQGSIYQGQATSATTTSPQLPSGQAANDDVRMEARCGEVLTYGVTVSPISGNDIYAGAIYQCSDCTAAPLE